MKVVISAWTEKISVGTVTDMTVWKAMWSTVVGAYGSNGNVYFEPLNEPYGYSLSQWVSVCSSWLSQFSSVPRSRVVISGTGYNDNVTGVGAFSALNGTRLSLHCRGRADARQSGRCCSRWRPESACSPTPARWRGAGRPVPRRGGGPPRGVQSQPAYFIRLFSR